MEMPPDQVDRAHDAFLSYSRVDKPFAEALEDALESYKPPRDLNVPKRYLDVFLDEHDLTGTEYTSAIQRHLKTSRKLVVICSPAARRSAYVNDEIRMFAQSSGAENIIPILFAGIPNNESRSGSETEWAFPEALCETMAMPLATSYRGFVPGRHKPNRGEFNDAWFTLLANIYGISRSELEQRERKREARRLRVLTSIGAGILLSLSVALAVSLLSLKAEKRAKEQAHLELASSYVAQANANRMARLPGRRLASLEVLTKAAEIRPSPEARNAAIASMALVDLRTLKEWDGFPLGKGLAFDSKLERYARSDEQGGISVRTIDADQEILSLPGPGTVAWVLRFSRDGQFLAAKYDNLHLLQVWDLNRREVVRSVAGGVCGSAVDFSPDSRWLVVGQCDRSIHLLDLAPGGEVRRFIQRAEPASIAIHPGGQWIALSSPQRDLAVQVLDVRAGTVIETFPHRAGVRGVAWSDDGELLAAACSDFRIYVWNVAKPDKPIATLVGHRAEPTGVAFGTGDYLLASMGWDGTLRIWDPLNETEELITASYSPGWPLQFQLDGQRLAWALGGSRLGVSEVVRRTEYRTLNSYREPGKGPFSADFSDDGRLVVSAHGDGVRLWDLSSGREAAFIVQRPGRLPLGYVRSVILHADGRRMITCGPDGGLVIWPISPDTDLPGSGLRIGPPQGVRLPDGTKCNWASLDASGRILALADAGRDRVILLNLEIGNSRPLPSGHPNIAVVTISSDGRWIASSSWGLNRNRIKVSDVEEKAPDWELESKLPGAAVSSGFSPDGKWLVTGIAEEAQVWEVGTWRTVSRLQTAGTIGPMAFAADGTLLAVAQARQQIKLYDPAREWNAIATLEAPTHAPYSSLVFSRDGGQLAAVSVNHVIQLWDLRRVRERLARMKLDWEHRPYALPRQSARSGPLRVTVVTQ